MKNQKPTQFPCDALHPVIGKHIVRPCWTGTIFQKPVPLGSPMIAVISASPSGTTACAMVKQTVERHVHHVLWLSGQGVLPSRVLQHGHWAMMEAWSHWTIHMFRASLACRLDCGGSSSSSSSILPAGQKGSMQCNCWGVGIVHQNRFVGRNRLTGRN